jgi:hypothetical protein
MNHQTTRPVILRWLTSIALVSALMAGQTTVVAVAADAEPTPTTSEQAGPSVERAEATRNGVRVSLRTLRPLAAGTPAEIHARVKNVSDRPIWWAGGTGALQARLRMADAEWRFGDSLIDLPEDGEPGFPAKQDLKNDIALYAGRYVTEIFLPLELVDHDIENQFNNRPVKIPPGGTVDATYTWSGFADVPLDQSGSAGLPPGGPADVVATAYYRLSQGGPQKTTSVDLRTEIVGGIDEGRLHPMEAVDAALANVEFHALMEKADFNHSDVGVVTFDIGLDRWYVGACGIDEVEGRAYWRLAGIEPSSGDLIELIDGYGGDECAAGTWGISTPEEAEA